MSKSFNRRRPSGSPQARKIALFAPHRRCSSLTSGQALHSISGSKSGLDQSRTSMRNGERHFSIISSQWQSVESCTMTLMICLTPLSFNQLKKNNKSLRPMVLALYRPLCSRKDSPRGNLPSFNLTAGNSTYCKTSSNCVV